MSKHYWHWVERLADEVLKRKPPYVITSGATISGPAHLGTICEFFFPAVIKKELERKGKEVVHYFIADIMDAFDSIPLDMKAYENELKPHLGKPLYQVPDPKGCHENYADHYLDEVRDAIKAMGLENRIKIIKSNEFYKSGAFDKYTLIFAKHINEIKEILEKTSGRTLPKNYFIIMPICEKCGKIATTKITSYKINDNDIEYEYECNKDVKYTKGCGYKGKGKMSKHQYKLQWRLHWVAWQQYFKTTIEGAGADHFTKGGSYDTAKVLHKKIFNSTPPIGYKFGLLLMKGKKYSKSKGTGMYVRDLLKLIPAKVIAYHLLKFDLEENIDFVPTKHNILKIIEDYEYASTLKASDELSRKDRKKYKAYTLAGEKEWNIPFRDVLMYFQIYKDWEKVKFHLNADEKSINFLKPYIEEWIKKDFVPENYDFSYKPKKAEGIVRAFFEALNNEMDALSIHNFIYDFAKQNNIEAKELFKEIYLTLIKKESGPRAGKLIYALGIEKIKKDVL